MDKYKQFAKYYKPFTKYINTTFTAYNLYKVYNKESICSKLIFLQNLNS